VSESLRIAIVGPSPRIVGGQSVQAGLLLRNWRGDERVEAEFIPIDPVFPRGLRWVERIPFLRTVVRTPIYLASLWRGLRRAHIAHVFSASYWSFLVAPAPAWLVARLRGTKVLLNYRSGEAHDHLTRWKSAAWLLRRTDLNVVPSGYLQDVFREFGIAAEAVPNVVDLSQFQFRERVPLRPRCVCTRGFGEYYRADLVAQAFSLIQQRYPEASLCLLGDGPLEARTRELVRRLGLRNVEFTGTVARDQIGAFYDRADIFLNASEVDNMPVSVLEAFAAGTPVATTAAGGIPYIVRHEENGLLSPPGDWQALAANACRLLDDAALAARLASQAHQDSADYHWPAVRERWLRLYERLA